MAYLIPENLRSDRSVPKAHRNVASALLPGLDNDVTIWYEPPFALDEERPDFVILDPTAGVTVLEVVDGEVLGAVRGKLRVRNGTEAEIEDPLAKAISFGERVVSLIANRPSLQRVTVCGVAVFPEITREQGLARGIDAVVAPEQALFKDDLREAKVTEEYLPRFLLRVHDGGAGEDLEPEQIDELRGILHPEIVIGPAPEQGSLFTTTAKEPVVKVMDRRQERLARKLGTGHRLIRGVAGSGKTLILLHRARFMARSFPNDRVLVTCFTRALASSLGAMLDEFPNVEVRTIHQVMTSAIREAGLPNPADKRNWDAVAGVALEAVERRRPDPYRAVLIDEAQDFTTEELRFCTGLFASDDPEEQDLLVVADRAQNIFSRNFTWKGAGISVAGRSTVMRTNYRNTREILEFAHSFLIDDPDIDVDDGDDVEALSIIPAESAERTGEPVRVELVDDVGLQVDAIVAQVACWNPDSKGEPRSIAVLMQSESVGELGKRLAGRFKAEGVDFFWVGDPADTKGKDRVGFATAPVLLSTVHSSKGLEFPKVIVTGMMEGKSIDNDRRVRDRKLLYVGFTRAVDELVVIGTKGNVFADSLKKFPQRRTESQCANGR